MKVHIKFWGGQVKEEELSLVVEDFLLDSYERGSVESVKEKVSNVAKAVGTLVDLLAEKNILSDGEIKKFTGNIEKISR